MLSFSQISSSGFTWTDEAGNTGNVTQGYNNSTSNGHLFYKNNILYEIFTDRILAKTDKSCVFVAIQPLSEWVIPHGLNSSTVVLVMKDDGTVVYPTKVIETTFNETKVVFSMAITGRANVRPT